MGILKQLVKGAVRSAASMPWIGPLIESSFVPLAAHFSFERAKNVDRGRSVEIGDKGLSRRLSPDLCVLRGPFEGLRYPHEQSHGSTLISKLIGSYESEIQPIVETCCRDDYVAVVDIGCAEGYYAVGLARRLANTRVLAVDIQPKALELCEQMAALNGVDDRVECASAFDWAWLDRLGPDERALILSDCEGFELELFSPESIRRLARHDVLIETHDFIDASISQTLRDRFEATHVVSEIWSLHDCFRATVCGIPELLEFDLQTRWRIIQEGRPKTMSWLVMRPRGEV